MQIGTKWLRGAVVNEYRTIDNTSAVRIVFFHFESNIGLLFEISNRIE